MSDCAALIRQRLRLGPAALLALLDWIQVCVLVGNADAHVKNLALLLPAEGRPSLAPYYDLVPTLYWSGQILERRPALAIGQAQFIDGIQRADWQALAKDCGFGASLVLARLRALASRILGCLDAVAARLVAEGGDVRRLSRVRQIVAAQCQHAIELA